MAYNYIIGLVIGQAGVVGFLLWPIFRVTRKAGYSRRSALMLIAVCFVCATAAVGMNILVAQQGWLHGLDLGLIGGAALAALLQFLTSPFTLAGIPFLYISFRHWPLESGGKEADIFG